MLILDYFLSFLLF